MWLTLTGVRMTLWPRLGFYQNSNNRQNEQLTSGENRSPHEMGFLPFIPDRGRVQDFCCDLWWPAVTGTRVAVLLLLSSSGCCVVSAQCGRSDLKMIRALFRKPPNVRSACCNPGGRDVKLSHKSFYALIKCSNNISGCSAMKREPTLLFDCHSVTCCAI